MVKSILDRSDAVRALAGVFRRRGFEASSLSVIQQETGLGRGSLYHFFPAGKKDMARAVLTQVTEWFEERVFTPLRASEDATATVRTMCQEVADYFLSRERVCLYAAMTLGEEQDTFAEPVRAYFTDWIAALTHTLRAGGLSGDDAAAQAMDAVASIQGGLILARAYADDDTLRGIVRRTEGRMLEALAATAAIGD